MKRTVSNPVFFRQDAAAPRASAIAPWVREAPVTAGSAQFTPRQLEVLALLCEGLPNKLICRRLNIATGTVKVHISSILRELGVASRLQAVVAARNLGIKDLAAAGTPDEDDAPTANRPTKAAGTRGGAGSGVIGLGI